MQLAHSAFGPQALRAAWGDVLANDADDGVLSPGVARFREEEDDELAGLQTDLAWGAYVPRDLTQVSLSEPGKTRLLHIPAVRDRIVARAILDAVTPLVDPHLGPGAYGFRPGLGVRDAVQAVARWRDEGLAWVLRTDIDECFPTVPVAHAQRLFDVLVNDQEISAVVDRLLSRFAVRPRRGRYRPPGLPQGCPLSPLLTNLVLSQLDADLFDAGFAVVRYADDLAVAAGSADLAWEACRVASRSLERWGMSLGADDTHALSFEEGFTFLGEDFGPRYPPVLDEFRVEEPDRKVLYAGLQGSRVRIAAGRVIVETGEDVEVLDVPSGNVSRLVCFGAVGVSAGFRSWALAHGVDVVLASRRGNYLGSIVGGSGSSRPQRVRAQVTIAGTPRAIELGRTIIDAKLRNQVTVLQRFGRAGDVDEVQPAIAAIRRVAAMLPAAGSASEVMGLEGAAAAAYFPALGSLLPPDVRFTHRSRQPPLDVANAGLSLLYTILTGECVTALYAAGLDPAFGVLHADDDHRPSLALDLVEEFRPLIVDQVVVQVLRKGGVQAKDGRAEEGRAGVLLTKAAKDTVVAAYERRMMTSVSGALPGFAGTWRRHLYRQAQRLALSILGDARYTGVSWR